MSNLLIVFDGKCHFCIATVNFILGRDNGKFSVIAVQDNLARKVLRDKGVKFIDLNTIYFIENEKVYVRSSAALRIFQLMSYPWKAVSAFRILPVNLTDAVYKFVAKNRYLFGRSETRIGSLQSKFPKRFLTEGQAPSSQGDSSKENG